MVLAFISKSNDRLNWFVFGGIETHLTIIWGSAIIHFLLRQRRWGSLRGFSGLMRPISGPGRAHKARIGEIGGRLFPCFTPVQTTENA